MRERSEQSTTAATATMARWARAAMVIAIGGALFIEGCVGGGGFNFDGGVCPPLPCRDSSECSGGVCSGGLCQPSAPYVGDAGSSADLFSICEEVARQQRCADCGGQLDPPSTKNGKICTPDGCVPVCTQDSDCGANQQCQSGTCKFRVDDARYAWDDNGQTWRRRCTPPCDAGTELGMCECGEICDDRDGLIACYPPCKEDYDCGHDQLCYQGRCRTPDPGPCSNNPSQQCGCCTVNSDCAAGYYCQVASWCGAAVCNPPGTCQALDTLTDPTSQYCIAVCRYDGQCPDGQSCLQSTCQITPQLDFPQPIAAGTPCSPSTSDVDCGGDQRCDSNGRCRPAAAQTSTATNTLSIQLAGSGGEVSSNTTQCEGACNAAIDVGSSVTLVATPDRTHAFTGWTGACAGTGPCNVTANGDQQVGANFMAIPDGGAPPPADPNERCAAVLRWLQKDAYKDTAGRTTALWPAHTTTTLDVYCDGNVGEMELIGSAFRENHGTLPDQKDANGDTILVETNRQFQWGKRTELLQLLTNYQKCECGTPFLSMDDVNAATVQGLLSAVKGYVQNNLQCDGGVATADVTSAISNRDIATLVTLLPNCFWKNGLTWRAVLTASAEGLLSSFCNYHVCNNDAALETTLFDAFVSGAAVPVCNAKNPLCSGPMFYLNPGTGPTAVSACVGCSANSPNGKACDDGNFCTQVDQCSQGTCVGSSPVSCPSGQACDPATGNCQ